MAGSGDPSPFPQPVLKVGLLVRKQGIELKHPLVRKRSSSTKSKYQFGTFPWLSSVSHCECQASIVKTMPPQGAFFFKHPFSGTPATRKERRRRLKSVGSWVCSALRISLETCSWIGFLAAANNHESWSGEFRMEMDAECLNWQSRPVFFEVYLCGISVIGQSAMFAMGSWKGLINFALAKFTLTSHNYLAYENLQPTWNCFCFTLTSGEAAKFT